MQRLLRIVCYCQRTDDSVLIAKLTKRWPARAICTAFCGVRSSCGDFQQHPGRVKRPLKFRRQEIFYVRHKNEFKSTDFCRRCRNHRGDANSGTLLDANLR